MSPPGKNSGRTTKVSVVKASRGAAQLHHGAVVRRTAAGAVAKGRQKQALDQSPHHAGRRRRGRVARVA